MHVGTCKGIQAAKEHKCWAGMLMQAGRKVHEGQDTVCWQVVRPGQKGLQLQRQVLPQLQWRRWQSQKRAWLVLPHH